MNADGHPLPIWSIIALVGLVVLAIAIVNL